MHAEDLYRLVYEHAMEAVLFTAPDGAILAANPAACRLFGRTEAEIRAAGRAGLVDPASPKLAQMLAEREQTGRARGELTFIRGDGSRFPAEVSSAQFTDTPGETRTVIMVRDLSERKRLEKEREQYFRLFRLTSEPMCIADPFGCFLHVNPAFVAATGYSEGELLSRPFLDFVLPEDRGRTAEEMRLQVAKRPSMQFENRYLRKDGTVILFSWFAYFDQNERVTYATARDITRTRLVETNLAESKALLTAIIDSTTDLIWAVDSDAFRLLTFNAGLREHVLRERGIQIAAGMGFDEFLPAESQARNWRELYKRALREGAFSVEDDAPGDGRTLRLTFNLLKRDGQVFGISVFGRDVTARAA